MVSLGIVFLFFVYETQENIRNIIFIMVLRRVGFKEGFRRGVGVVKRRPGLWGGRLSAGVSAWRGFSIGLFHLGFSICISRRCSGPGR